MLGGPVPPGCRSMQGDGEAGVPRRFGEPVPGRMTPARPLLEAAVHAAAPHHAAM